MIEKMKTKKKIADSMGMTLVNHILKNDNDRLKKTIINLQKVIQELKETIDRIEINNISAIELPLFQSFIIKDNKSGKKNINDDGGKHCLTCKGYTNFMMVDHKLWCSILKKHTPACCCSKYEINTDKYFKDEGMDYDR